MLVLAAVVPLGPPASAAPGDLHVSLELADGSPGTEGVVYVYPVGSETFVSIGRPDSSGELVLTGVEEGDYEIEIQGGKGFRSQWAPGVNERAAAQTVTIAPGTTTSLDVTLLTLPAVTGTIRETGTNRPPNGNWGTVVVNDSGGGHDAWITGNEFLIYLNSADPSKIAFEFPSPFTDEQYQTWIGGDSVVTAAEIDVDFNEKVDVGEVVVEIPGRLVVDAFFETLYRPVEEPEFFVFDGDGMEVRPLNFLEPQVTPMADGFETTTEIISFPGAHYVLVYWPGTGGDYIQAVFPTWSGNAPLYRFDQAAPVILPSSGTATVEVKPPAFYPDMFGSIFLMDIVWMHYTAITTGCGAAGYCPDDPVTRGQMAAFLVRALGLTESNPNIEFTDDDNSVFQADIERLATAGITSGCGEGIFCPNDPVTRGQMAAFLVRAMNYTDQGNTDFTDDNGNVFEADIERLAAAGVTSGCGPETFCPNDNVTRGQMAAFLHRALGGGVLYPGEAGSDPTGRVLRTRPVPEANR